MGRHDDENILSALRKSGLLCYRDLDAKLGPPNSDPLYLTREYLGFQDSSENWITLSDGQLQRISLARFSLMADKDTTLAILDEPEANLDPEGISQVLEIIESLKKNGTTVVIISHHPCFIKVADRVFRIEEGKMNEITAEKRE